MYRRSFCGKLVLKLVVNNCFPESSKPPLPTKPKRRCPPREYRPDEVGGCHAAKSGRYQTRDSLLILLLWRHGLQGRSIDLRWSNIDWNTAHRQAAQNGRHSNQPIDGRELRLLRASSANQTVSSGFSWARGNTSQWRYGGKSSNAPEVAFDFPSTSCSPCLRLRLAAKGTDTIQDYLGHQNIQYTVLYRTRPRSLDGWDNFKTCLLIVMFANITSRVANNFRLTLIATETAPGSH